MNTFSVKNTFIYKIFLKKVKVNHCFFLQIGDHIASIDDISVVGYRHYEVAKMLKEKKRGSTITLSLYEPIKLGFGKCKN